MKTFLLGVALLCISHQVSGNEDFLRSLFDDKVKELNDQKAEPSVFLTADLPTNQGEQERYAVECDAMAVVAYGNQLIKDTLDIMENTFDVVYLVMYPSADQTSCSSAAFRCFIKELNDVKDAIQTVKDNVMNYKDEASWLIDGIRMYIQDCVR